MTLPTPETPTPDHAWIHDRITAALAAGLSPAEQSLFDAHINNCPDCFDAFTEARDADRSLQRTLSALAPSQNFEQALLETLREKTQHHRFKPLLKRTGIAIAAAVALAATGVLAQYLTQTDTVTAPLANQLALSNRNQGITLPTIWDKNPTSASESSTTRNHNAENLRGLANSLEVYSSDFGAYPTAPNIHGIIESKIVYSSENNDEFPPIKVSSGLSAGEDLLQDGDPRISLGRTTTLKSVSRGSVVYKLDTSGTTAGKEIASAETKKSDWISDVPQRDGQNVYFGDGHTEFDKRPDSGKSPGINIFGFREQTSSNSGLVGKITLENDNKKTATEDVNGSFDGKAFEKLGRTSLIKDGEGILTLGGANAYHGETTVTGGTLNTAFRKNSTNQGTGVAESPPTFTGAITDTGRTPSIYSTIQGGYSYGKATGSGNVTVINGTMSGAAGEQGQEGGQQQNFVSNFNQTINADKNGELALNDYYKPSFALQIQGQDDPGLDRLKSPKQFAAKTDPHIMNNQLDLKLGRTRSTAGVASVTDLVATTDDPSHPPVFNLSDITKSGASGQGGGPGNSASLFADAGDGKGDKRSTESPQSSLDAADHLIPHAESEVKTAKISTDPPAATQPTPPASGQPGTEVAERKIIRNGTVEFEVRSFDDAATTISQVVNEERGFVSSTASDKLANGKIRGTVIVRVPPEHLDRTLLKLRSLGDLKTQQIAADDVTKQYTDIDSELRAQRAIESRLIDLIKNGKGEVKDLVVAEQQLGEHRIRIEKLEGEIRYYNNLVSMATLTITAYEKDIQTPTAASEMEQVNLSLETEDVEAKYKDARKILDDSKGRIVESELKKLDADQYNAHIVVDIPPDKADLVAAQLKQIGRVANYTRDRKQTTTGGDGVPTVQVEQKDARFTITLYNLANIAPRETTVLTVAVRDVDASYHKIIDLVRKPGLPKLDDAGKPIDGPPKPKGRIITSGMAGQLPQQMSADIHADIFSDDAQSVLAAIQDTGEVLTTTSAENADTANSTSAKRGIQLHLVNVAAVPPREIQEFRAVATDVPEAYKKLLTTLQSPANSANIRIIATKLTESDAQTVSATLTFEARRESLPAVDKAFTDAGIDFLARNVIRSDDTSTTLDSKVRFQIDELLAADALIPRRTTVLGVEVDNVEKAMDTLRASLANPNIKELDYNLTKEQNGNVTGHLVVETPIANALSVLTHIKDIGGTEKMNRVMKNNQVPDAPYARERIDLTLTLTPHEPIIENGKGLAPTIRAALASSATALLYSLYYIITGILFLGPFALVAWIIYRVARRRRPKTT